MNNILSNVTEPPIGSENILIIEVTTDDNDVAATKDKLTTLIIIFFNFISNQGMRTKSWTV